MPVVSPATAESRPLRNVHSNSESSSLRWNLNSALPGDSKSAFLHVTGIGCDASGVTSHSREQTIM